jgi:hypothetical protein
MFVYKGVKMKTISIRIREDLNNEVKRLRALEGKILSKPAYDNHIFELGLKEKRNELELRKRG